MTVPDDVNECSPSQRCYLFEYPELGTRVRIIDGSEAHGDEGTMWHVNRDSGIALVDLSGCVWPVSSPTEVEIVGEVAG